ncbi:integral inner membrane protein [Bacillus freudenreichii]|nr:integral inner membrane protein [Bacillus freudenreichii]
MFNQAFFFLLLLLCIGVVAKNQSLVIAVSVLIILKLAGADEKLFGMIQVKGINWGITVITIAVLAPIASGYIGFRELSGAIKSPYAWIALGAGMAVAVIAKYGVTLLSEDPHITTALVLGTIMAVSLFKGVAVGPLIGAGIAYMAMKFFELFRSGSGMGG